MPAGPWRSPLQLADGLGHLVLVAGRELLGPHGLEQLPAPPAAVRGQVVPDRAAYLGRVLLAELEHGLGRLDLYAERADGGLDVTEVAERRGHVPAGAR